MNGLSRREILAGSVTTEQMQKATKLGLQAMMLDVDKGREIQKSDLASVCDIIDQRLTRLEKAAEEKGEKDDRVPLH